MANRSPRARWSHLYARFLRTMWLSEQGRTIRENLACIMYNTVLSGTRGSIWSACGEWRPEAPVIYSINKINFLYLLIGEEDISPLFLIWYTGRLLMTLFLGVSPWAGSGWKKRYTLNLKIGRWLPVIHIFCSCCRLIVEEDISPLPETAVIFGYRRLQKRGDMSSSCGH